MRILRNRQPRIVGIGQKDPELRVTCKEYRQFDIEGESEEQGGPGREGGILV